MRKFFFILGLMSIQFTVNGQQVRIEADSLFIDDVAAAAYGLDIKNPQEFIIEVYQLNRIEDAVKNVFQALVEQDLNSKGILQSAKLRFQYQWNVGLKSAGTPEEDPAYVYAQIMGIQKFLSTKVNITVDFGQSRGFFTDARLRDEKTGEVQSFNSMVDALNYMALDGWEFVQAYVITAGQQNVYHYLLRRKP